jgi:hypothetical protein
LSLYCLHNGGFTDEMVTISIGFYMYLRVNYVVSLSEEQAMSCLTAAE